jgi:DNA-binding CsgD family transcriptional regulator
VSGWKLGRDNEFGLTHRQVEAVQALVRLGNEKLVAHELGVTRLSVNRLIREAQRSLGVRSRVHLALKWDRRMADLRLQIPSSVFDLAMKHGDHPA